MDSLTSRICRNCNQLKEATEFNKTEYKYKSGRCRTCVAKAKLSEKKKPRELDLDETDIECRTWQGGKRNKSKGTRVNQYKIIFDASGIPKYLVVQLSKDFVTLCDYEQLDFVKNHFLCVSKSGHQNSKEYCTCLVDGKNKGFHNQLTGFEMVDHINGFPLDNRMVNMRNTNHKQNNSNRSLIHKTFIRQVDGKIEGNIVYNDHSQYFKKIVVSELFDTSQECKEWIHKKSNELNGMVLTANERFELAEEYEAIMNQHAEHYKWKTNISEEDLTDIANALPSTTKASQRLETYEKFKESHPSWNITEELTRSIKLQHITDSGVEYKFCSSCTEAPWHPIDEFHKSSSKHDGLDTRCKMCAKKRNKTK